MSNVSRHVVRRALIVTTVVVVLGGASARPLTVYLWPAAIVSIDDASRSIDVSLRAPPDLKAIYALDVVGVGRVEGEAEIALVLNGARYKPRHLGGAVLFTWGGDWYGPEAVVRYTPTSGASGSIVLSYRFRSL
jgi:hypothetical protein